MTGISILVTDGSGIAFLLIILINILHSRKNTSLDNKLFVWMLISCIVILAVDAFTWIVNGTNFDNAEKYNLYSNTIYFGINPMVTCLWMFYVDYKIFQDRERLKKRVFLYLGLPILNIFFSIVNIFYPLYFYIDKSNEFVRAEYMWFNVGIIYLFILYPIFLIVINKKRLERKTFWPLILFPMPPIILSIVQLMHFGLSLIWLGEAISLMIIYVYIQDNLANIDALTGLNNRRCLEDYLIGEFKKKGADKIISGIMIDFDDFKYINDNFGHLVGDDALLEVGRIMQKVIGKNDFLARYAGDEFIVVFSNKNEAYAIELVKGFQSMINDFNDTNHQKYKLSFSYGFGSCKVLGNSVDTLLKIMDNKMYENKKTYHTRLR